MKLTSCMIMLVAMSGSALGGFIAYGLQSRMWHPPSVFVNRVVHTSPPPILCGFWADSETEQRNKISNLRSFTYLPNIIEKFLNSILLESTDDVLKNITASLLVTKGSSPREIFDILSGAVTDLATSERWRCYAIQHLADLGASHHEFMNESVELLTPVAEGKGVLASTALLQLSRLVASSHSQSLYTWIHAKVSDSLEDPNADHVMTVSLLGIASEQQWKDLLPAIRNLAASHILCVRRSSLAALARIGDLPDRALLLRAQRDADPSIVFAANAALRHFESRFPTLR